MANGKREYSAPREYAAAIRGLDGSRYPKGKDYETAAAVLRNTFQVSITADQVRKFKGGNVVGHVREMAERERELRLLEAEL